ncbi:MAG: recombinase family protein [Ruminococcus flavefaciens]|nr:recombinase family protein [Ruminococcus flavefaciens]
MTNPHGRLIGYARVSTTGQSVDRQVDAMINYGLDIEDIYIEKESGKSFNNRPIYKKLIRILRRGDILVIMAIDRLGRNYQEIIDQWRLITQDIGCGIHVIDMPLLNTSGDPNDLLSKFITDMMLQVLSFVAENERETTLKRQKEGLEAARRRGNVQIGRPRAKIPYEFWDVYLLWKSGTVKTMDLVRYSKETYGICKRTFYRRIRELDAQFGDYPYEQLELMDVSEFKAGFPYIKEEEEAALGYYNPYRNDPDKEKAASDARKHAKLKAIQDAQDSANAELRQIIREKRQTEFASKFPSTIQDPVRRGKKPTIPLDLNEMNKTIIIK